MPVSPTYPGVYVQEVSSGVRTIAGVSTSIALFVGYTKSGPLNEATQCFSFSDYLREFGDDVTAGDMARHVKLFFQNGGTNCYVFRVADNTANSTVTLESEAGTSVLTLTAKNPGTAGDLIRATVTYSGNQPEDTFNLTIFRWEVQSNGTLLAKDTETWSGLSMDPASGNNAVSFLNTNSKLVTASTTVTLASAGTAASVGMALTTAASDADFATALNNHVTAGRSTFQISVDGSAYVSVTLPSTLTAGLATEIETVISNAFSARGLTLPGATFAVRVLVDRPRTGSRALAFTSTAGNVWIRPGATNDLTTTLLLGSAQGGYEQGRFAGSRPAATGVAIRPTTTNDPTAGGFLGSLAALVTTNAAPTLALNEYDSDGVATGSAPLVSPFTATAASVSARLGELRDAINNHTVAAGSSFPWSAEVVGNRLVITPTAGPMAAGSDDNRSSGFTISTASVDTVLNIRYYALGTSGTGSFTNGGIAGDDGDPPSATSSYDTAYATIDEQVDLFTLLVLPRDNSNRALVDDAYPNASVYAESRRALLVMEPPEDWTGTTTPLNEIADVRIGHSKQYAALYYPRLLIKEGNLQVTVGAAGAIAGLMARIDTARGVWKAPAGTEATIRGIVGLEQKFSDAQNGVLNPKGINLLRVFPDGVVSWGARTLDGYDEAGSEYKYVPIRRLANYIEESLFRGLKWVVFEPNDEPLWAQIRLNVGAFMHNLFRQGAFQGQTPSEAYFVKCDAETTTQNDRNLGIVNIWVGFAPLKPAEFVVLSLQQMAGQVEV